jgi:hypothetical protein
LTSSGKGITNCSAGVWSYSWPLSPSSPSGSWGGCWEREKYGRSSFGEETIPERHKKWTGAENNRIKENFKRAYETFPNIDFIARTPLIPGVNADEEHIRAVLAFIKPYKSVIVDELLPYHRFGLGKYELTGVVYELDD